MSEYIYINTLDDVAALKDGWDGYEAKKFSAEHLKFIRKILRKLPKEPMIFPTARNSVQLEYVRDDGGYLEFEIYANKKIGMYRLDHNGNYLKIVNIDEMVKEIRLFV